MNRKMETYMNTENDYDDEYFEEQPDWCVSKEEEQEEEDHLPMHLRNKGMTVGADGYYYNKNNERTIFRVPVSEKEIVEEEVVPAVEISVKPAPWAHLLETKKKSLSMRDIMLSEEEKNARDKNAKDKNTRDKNEKEKSEKEKNSVKVETKPHKKTQWCYSIISNGMCRRKDCNFAHTETEFEFNQCKWRTCKKESCHFKHQWESYPEFKARIGFTVPDKLLAKMAKNDLKELQNKNGK